MKKKTKAFTLAEALIVLVILGIVAALCMVTLKPYNTAQTGNDIKGDKVVSILSQAFTNMFIYDSSYDDFSRLNYKGNYISIANEDERDEFVKLLKKYLVLNDHVLDLNNEYFSGNLYDFKKVSLGALTDLYDNFTYLQDGTLLGFRTYGSCSATEENANPPKYRAKFSVNNICGSIFMDTNGFKRPNKLGSDQFIVPIDLRGTKYTNNEDD